jgi:SAM-dependent methyltransferase
MQPFKYKFMKTYKDVDGWFDYEDIMQEAVNKAPIDTECSFVEIGSWLGRSTAFMAQAIKDSRKPIKFYAVDTWAGSIGDSAFFPVLNQHGGNVYQVFVQNMLDCGIEDYVYPIKSDSIAAAKEAAALGHKFDFIFIDGAHDYASVRADLTAWLPLLKEGGIFAGHDLGCPGVNQALDEVLGGKYKKYIGGTSGSTWIKIWLDLS